MIIFTTLADRTRERQQSEERPLADRGQRTSNDHVSQTHRHVKEGYGYKRQTGGDLDSSSSSLSASVSRAVLVEMSAILGEVAVSLVAGVHPELALDLVDDADLLSMVLLHEGVALSVSRTDSIRSKGSGKEENGTRWGSALRPPSVHSPPLLLVPALRKMDEPVPERIIVTLDASSHARTTDIARSVGA